MVFRQCGRQKAALANTIGELKNGTPFGERMASKLTRLRQAHFAFSHHWLDSHCNTALPYSRVSMMSRGKRHD